ncbi:MAG: response regulator [Deltaproteobacteria bacterium]|nr:response regulator [Deltaproteobacteria bacterium]
MSPPDPRPAASRPATESELTELRRSERLLRTIFATTSELILIASPEGTVQFARPLQDGLTERDVVGRSVYDFVEPRFHDTVRACIARVLETRTPDAYEVDATPGAATTGHYYVRVGPVIEDGRVVSLAFLATNISKLQEARAALTASEAKLRFAIAATGLGLWSWDPNYDVGEFDPGLAKIFGFDPVRPPTTLAGIAEYIHPDDQARVRSAVLGALESGTYPDIEHRIVRGDGEIRWVFAKGAIDRAPDGSPLRLVGGALDITDRKRLEEQLLQAQKLESVGRLAGGVAHDFNNMLTVILACAEAAGDELPASSPVRPLLDTICQAAQRSAGLTRQLLSFARRQPLRPAVIEVAAVIRGLEPLFHTILGEQIELVLDLAATGRVRTDLSQLEQTLMNLVTNARDAMPSGGRAEIAVADVVLEAQALRGAEALSGAFLRIDVRDSGAGIAAEHIAHLFEPFFTTKGSRGTGLGLASSYGFAKQSGGHIWAENAPGSGAVFHLLLPSADGGEGDDASPEYTREERGHGETILVAEDEALVLRSTVYALRGLGYRVIEAASGEEALGLLAREPGRVALLLTDVVMPRMTGPELARRVRELRPGLPVLFMSGHLGDAAEEAAEKATTEGLLEKPFTSEALAQMIRRCIERG